MAEAQVAQLQTPKLTFNQAVIQGKILSKRKIDTQQGLLYLTLLRLPAPDEYTSPATIELRSRDPLGDVGENYQCRVQLGGVQNNYETKTVDKETGDEKKVPVKSARNEYTVIATAA